MCQILSKKTDSVDLLEHLHNHVITKVVKLLLSKKAEIYQVEISRLQNISYPNARLSFETQFKIKFLGLTISNQKFDENQ